ncbi:MAG: ATP-binding protein [Synergistaceae bacterium]|nr:ATP-binding protein [Synergistaceae bacterium]
MPEVDEKFIHEQELEQEHEHKHEQNPEQDLERSKICYTTCQGLQSCEFDGWVSFLPEIAFKGTPEILSARCQTYFNEEELRKRQQEAALKQRQIEETVRSGKMPERLRKCTFESFCTDTDTVPARSPNVVAMAKKLALRAFTENSSIVLAGRTGVGKSHLAAAILNRSLKSNKTGLFIPFISLLSDLKNSFETDMTGRIIEALRTVDCLVLDDIGQEMQTNYSSERLFEIVDYRYNRYKQLVITTNCHNWEALERKIGERGPYIVRRLKSMGSLISIDIPAYKNYMPMSKSTENKI